MFNTIFSTISIFKQTHLNASVKIAVRVPLERDGLERAKPLVSKI